MKEYFKVKQNDKNITHIKVEVSYNLGGYNNFTSTNETRGYYINVLPVELCNHGNFTSERYLAFTGSKLLLNSVSRRGKKAEMVATEKAEKVKDMMVKQVAFENGLILESEV